MAGSDSPATVNVTVKDQFGAAMAGCGLVFGGVVFQAGRADRVVRPAGEREDQALRNQLAYQQEPAGAHRQSDRDLLLPRRRARHCRPRAALLNSDTVASITLTCAGGGSKEMAGG